MIVSVPRYMQIPIKYVMYASRTISGARVNARGMFFFGFLISCVIVVATIQPSNAKAIGLTAASQKVEWHAVEKSDR